MNMYQVEVWDTHWRTHSGLVVADNAEQAAGALAHRLELDHQWAGRWLAVCKETGEVEGTVVP